MGYFRIFKWQIRSITRDPMSMFLSLIPFLFILLIKYAIPALFNFLLTWVDLRSYTNFVLFVFYLMTPSLLGIVLGLLLMDERDLDILSYINVTPISTGRYIWFKSLLGVIGSILVNLIICKSVGEELGVRELLLFINSSLLVPIYALVIFSFSKNKVQGLTIGKLANFVVIGAVIPFFVTSPLVNILGVLPTFWSYYIYYGSSPIIMFISGSILSIIYIYALFKRATR